MVEQQRLQQGQHQGQHQQQRGPRTSPMLRRRSHPCCCCQLTHNGDHLVLRGLHTARVEGSLKLFRSDGSTIVRNDRRQLRTSSLQLGADNTNVALRKASRVGFHVLQGVHVSLGEYKFVPVKGHGLSNEKISGSPM